MPATKEKHINLTPPPNIEILGLIAGGGAMPQKVIAACQAQGVKPFVVGFEGHTDPSVMDGVEHMWSRLGAAGQIIKTLKSHHVHDLVLIGSVRRPSLSELRPDLKTAGFFAKFAMRSIGDSDLLSLLREFLEDEGFRLHGVHKFAQDLLVRPGLLSKSSPSKSDWVDIVRGFDVTQNLGGLDIGQAAIVQEGIVLGVEAAEGTDELIRRCLHLKRKGRGGVLVKTCKPEQDVDLDLPTIGPETIRCAAEAGLSGLVVHAGKSLILEEDRTIDLANKDKLFLLSADTENIDSQR
jgi:hypothetical protein